MSQVSEDDLIARFFAPIAGAGGLGLRDDAALVSVPAGHEVVVTTDALVAGVHFFADDPPRSIAHKALAVNVSDLAAKGADPTGFVLSLALSAGWTSDWLQAFAEGLAAAASCWHCPLLGGDTVSTPGPLTLSITAFGTVPSGRMVRRTGARDGDGLYVSGTVGDGALGLQIRLKTIGQDADHATKLFLLDRYLHPQPRVVLRSALLNYARAAMDVSDGLVGDARKMLRVSGVTGVIDLARIPLSPAAQAVLKAHPDSLRTALTGGDDYEILASVPAASREAFESAAAEAGVPVTRIGEVLAGSDAVLFRDRDGHPVAFERGSFSHF